MPRISRADAFRNRLAVFSVIDAIRVRAARGVEVALELAALVVVAWLLGSFLPRLVSPVEEAPLPSQGSLGASSTGAPAAAPGASRRLRP